jgi:hypothetical protein
MRIILDGLGLKIDKDTMRYALKKRVVDSLILALMLPLTTWADTVNLQPISGSGINNRWMDIADNLYSSTYQNSFTYAQPLVTISYNNTSGTFSGTLTAPCTQLDTDVDSPHGTHL